MNDYPFNRVVLEIVELLQDLRDQGMEFIFSINSIGSFDCYLFEDEEYRNRWLDNGLPPTVRASVSDGDVEAALELFNKLIEYKVVDDFDWFEYKLAKAEYEEER